MYRYYITNEVFLYYKSIISTWQTLLFVLSWTKQLRPLQSELWVTAAPTSHRRLIPIGPLRSCDHNRTMAASAAVRSSAGLTFRLCRAIPDCNTCPLNRLKSCANSTAPSQRNASFESFRTINRHLQTSIGECYCLLTDLASIRHCLPSRGYLFTIYGHKWSLLFQRVLYFSWQQSLSRGCSKYMWSHLNPNSAE